VSAGRIRVIGAVVVLLALAAGGWLWLRDSSLVAVQRVTITGASGPDAGAIRAALTTAARNMTTLDVHENQLQIAVSPYPAVKAIQVTAQFPHGMRINVVEQLPVAVVSAGGQTIEVAADGTLLHNVAVSEALPVIPLRVSPGGPRLTDPDALQAVALLAAAPHRLLGSVSTVSTIAGKGLVAQLRNGPSIIFGDASRPQAKWLAAAAVLADSGSAGAAYVDVTDPERPAAGAGQQTASGSALAGSGTTATGTTTTSGG
jgi:cell division protein FtsQ